SGRTPASESLLALTRIMNRIVLSSWLSTYTTSEVRGNRRFGPSLSDPSRVCRPHPLTPSPFRRGGTHDVPPLPKGEGGQEVRANRRQSPRRRERALSPTRPRREGGHPAGRGSGPARTQRIAGTAVAAR